MSSFSPSITSSTKMSSNALLLPRDQKVEDFKFTFAKATAAANSTSNYTGTRPKIKVLKGVKLTPVKVNNNTAKYLEENNAELSKNRENITIAENFDCLTMNHRDEKPAEIKSEMPDEILAKTQAETPADTPNSPDSSLNSTQLHEFRENEITDIDNIVEYYNDPQNTSLDSNLVTKNPTHEGLEILGAILNEIIFLNRSTNSLRYLLRNHINSTYRDRSHYNSKNRVHKGRNNKFRGNNRGYNRGQNRSYNRGHDNGYNRAHSRDYNRGHSRPYNSWHNNSDRQRHSYYGQSNKNQQIPQSRVEQSSLYKK